MSKYRLKNSRTSSGSRFSEVDVKPTRSANRTVTRRRWATGGAGPADVETGGAAAAGLLRAAGAEPAASAKPHAPQNFIPSGVGAPQFGQDAARAAPHSPQNLKPAGFSLPQLAQRMARKGIPSSARRWGPHRH